VWLDPIAVVQSIRSCRLRCGDAEPHASPLAPRATWRESFSQSGEDLIVRYIFDILGTAQPTYLDIEHIIPSC
jgi:hypothetical protein